MYCLNVKTLPIAALLLALLPVSGCGKASEVAVEQLAERAIERETGGGAQFNIDSEGGRITLQSGDGENAITMQAGESVELPDGLPADVPLPQGATWHLVQTASEGGGRLMLQGTVDTPLADLAETLKSGAAEQGWETVQNISQPGQLEMMTFSKGEQTLTYNLSSDGDKTSVTVAKG